MAEYIEREAALECLKKYSSVGHDGTETYKTYCAEIWGASLDIYNLPAADVAPVVRCKECEFHTFLGKCKVHSQEPDQYGPGHDVTMAPDDFCSYGKRKQLEE